MKPNVSIEIDDVLMRQINAVAKQLNISCEVLVREAITEWLQRHNQCQWPLEILTFKGVEDFEGFESHRDELKAPADDPFAS